MANMIMDMVNTAGFLMIPGFLALFMMKMSGRRACCEKAFRNRAADCGRRLR